MHKTRRTQNDAWIRKMAPADMDEEEIAELVGMEEDDQNQRRIAELRNQLKGLVGQHRQAEKYSRLRAEKNKLLARKQAERAALEDQKEKEEGEGEEGQEVKKSASKQRRKKERDLFKPLPRRKKPKRVKG